MRKNAYATIKWSHLQKLTDDLSIQSRISECFVNATVFIRVSTHANVFSRISGRVLIALVTDFEGATIFFLHMRLFSTYAFLDLHNCFPNMQDAAVFFFNPHKCGKYADFIRICDLFQNARM